jgi:hypothetical protein
MAEGRYDRVVRNVRKMISQGAPEFDIDGYLDSEGLTPSQFKRIVEGPTIGGQLKEAVKGIVPGAIGLVEQAAVGASALLPDQYEAGAQEAIRGVAAAAKKPFAPEAGYEESVGRKFGEAAGSFVPFLGLGALGVAGRVGAGALGVGAGSGEALTKAQQEGATPSQQSIATGLGAIVGLSELITPFRILSRIPEGEVLTAANRIKRVAMAGGEEAAQEAAAGLAQNLIARGVYKPEQQLVEGLGEQAAYGGAVGALAQGLLDVALGRRAKTAATPAQPTTPAVEEQATTAAVTQPAAPTTFAPVRGVPETATQQDLFTEENIQRTAQSTRDAQDRLFKLRDEFDLYQRENERLAAAYERETDPTKKQQIYDQAVALAKPLNELKTQIDAVKGTLGAAEGARPGTGEPQLDFEAPLPSIGDRVGQVTKTEYRPDTGAVIGEEAAAPRLNEQQQRMLEEQRVQGIRDKIAAGEPVTQADMMRVKFLEREQYQEEAAKPTPALDLSQQKVTRFPLTLQRTDIEQPKMKVQEQPAAPETRPVTEQDFRTMGIGATNKKLRSELLGKDLSNPEDRRFVKERLEAFASDPNRSPGIVKKVENFLDSPIFFEQMELPLAPRRKQRVKQPKQPVAGASEPSVPVPDQGAAVAAPGPEAPVTTGVGEPALRAEPRDVAEGKQPAPVNPEVETLRKQYQRRVDKGTMELADAKPIEDLLANPTPENINQARQILKGTATVGEGVVAGVALTPEEQRALDKEAKATVRREGAGTVKIPGTLYRTQRSEEQAAGMDPAIVEDYVAQIVDGWKNAPVIDVVNTPADLPKRLREGTDIQPGLFDPVTGRVFVIASNLKNELDLFQTVLHETVGHYGMRSLLGDSYTQVMNNLYNGNEKVREAAKEKMEANSKLTKEVAVEEFLAEVAERNIKPNPSKADKSLGNQIVRFFRNALRKLFGKKADLISDTEVLDIVAEARMFVQTGTPTQGYKNVSDREVPLYRTPTPTLTAAGQQAQAAVAAMAGITNAKPKGPQMSTLQKVGAFFQDPSYRQDQIDKFRVQVAYKGAAAESKLAMLNQYNGKIRDALGNIRPDVFMTAAEHADTMAVAVMKDGKLKLDPKVGWVAEKGTASFQGVIDKIKDLGTKLGDQQLAFKLANDAFIARRANYFKQHPQLGISGLPDDAKIKAGMQAFKDFPELEAAFKEFTTFKNNLIDAGVDAGRFSKEQAAEWKEAADYVPWNRIKDYEDKIATSPQAYFRGLTNLKQMKEIRGGTEEINDIFDNMVGLSFWLVNGAIRNHAAVQLTDAFVSNGLGARQVRQGQPGVDPNKTIYIYRDGKPEVYEYESIADVYAFKGVESMGGPILSSFTAFANILRRTTTATPQFAASQLFQDAYRATVTSGVKNPFEVAAKVLTGAVDAYRGDATTQQLEKFGIVGAYDLMPGRAKDEIEKEFGIRQRSVLEKGLSFMESFSIASDASLRKAVFEQTLEETKSPQFPDGDVLLARYRAQEVINFKRQGANRTVGLMRQLIPFMNAYIQGMDVFYRTMTGRGIAATERSEAFKMFLGTGVKLATLATIYTMLVGGDDEYEGLRDYEKDKNFIVPGTGVKIPVAPEVGFFFKVIPERMYNYVASQGTERPQDAAALRKAIGTAAFDAFSGPNLTPQAVKPALELLVNYSFFTGTPIVGRGLEKLEPAQQFTDSTSEIAKMIGGLAGISPMKLEYFVRGTTGIAGGTVLDLSNMLFTDRPDKRLYEMPAFKTFMYDKIPGGYKEQYYDLREKVEQVVYTMNGLKAQGRAEELQEYLNDDRINLLALRRSMNQIDQQLEKMRAFRKLISNDPTMTGAQKKDQLDEIERTENELLRAYNIPALRKEVAGL